MIRTDLVKARLEERVEELAGRLYGAGPLGKFVDQDVAPVQQSHGYVVLGGLQGGKADVATGYFHQHFMETVSVFVVERHAGDATGEKAMAKMSPLIRKVIFAICGWCPGEGTDGEALGVFVLGNAYPLGFKDGGMLLSEIQFALNDQLRIQNP